MQEIDILTKESLHSIKGGISTQLLVYLLVEQILLETFLKKRKVT